jgi:hypothetical protein
LQIGLIQAAGIDHDVFAARIQLLQFHVQADIDDGQHRNVELHCLVRAAAQAPDHAAKFSRAATKPPAIFAKFLCLAVYAGRISSYSTGGRMDIIFIGGIVGFLLLSWALAAGCDSLGARR